MNSINVEDFVNDYLENNQDSPLVELKDMTKFYLSFLLNYLEAYRGKPSPLHLYLNVGFNVKIPHQKEDLKNYENGDFSSYVSNMQTNIILSLDSDSDYEINEINSVMAGMDAGSVVSLIIKSGDSLTKIIGMNDVCNYSSLEAADKFIKLFDKAQRPFYQRKFANVLNKFNAFFYRLNLKNLKGSDFLGNEILKKKTKELLPQEMVMDFDIVQNLTLKTVIDYIKEKKLYEVKKIESIKFFKIFKDDKLFELKESFTSFNDIDEDFFWNIVSQSMNLTSEKPILFMQKALHNYCSNDFGLTMKLVKSMWSSLNDNMLKSLIAPLVYQRLSITPPENVQIPNGDKLFLMDLSKHIKSNFSIEVVGEKPLILKVNPVVVGANYLKSDDYRRNGENVISDIDGDFVVSEVIDTYQSFMLSVLPQLEETRFFTSTLKKALKFNFIRNENCFLLEFPNFQILDVSVAEKFVQDLLKMINLCCGVISRKLEKDYEIDFFSIVENENKYWSSVCVELEIAGVLKETSSEGSNTDELFKV